MPNHDEELKRFRKNPPEEPDKEFSDAFERFAREEDLKKTIHNCKGTNSEIKKLYEQYNELLKNDNKSLEKKLLEAKSQAPLSEGKDKAQRQKSPNNRGRPAGSGSYQTVDRPFCNEMRRLIKNDASLSVTAAAELVADDARGNSFESTVKRLVKRYRKTIWTDEE